ncbi:MAG: caspase family protein [Planctomycetales bacterium]|nr:caspase family protein [Planctomycetales bacterium]
MIGTSKTTKLLSILTFLFATQDLQSQQKSMNYALLVGVTSYQHAEMNRPELKFPEADAKSVADFLAKNGYEVELLLGPQATSKRIEEKLEALGSRGNSRSVVLIGLWGHGVEFEDTKETMFCPFDTTVRFAKDSDGKTLYGSDGKPLIEPDPKSLVGMGTVLTGLRISGAGNRILFADCCRTSPNRARGRAFGANVRQADIPENTLAILACKPNEQAFEHDDWGHGAMTKGLLDILPSLAGRKDDYAISIIGPLTSSVRDMVRSVSNGKSSQTIHPILNGNPVLRMNEPAIEHLGYTNWVQASAPKYSVGQFDPRARYVIEFWPRISENSTTSFRSHLDELARAQAIEDVQVAIVFSDSENRVKSLLEQQASSSEGDDKTESIAERLKGVAVSSDPTRSLAIRYFKNESEVNEAYVYFLGQGGRRNWNGKIDEFDLSTQLACDAIGSLAPELAIDTWFTDGNGRFKHETSFQPGNIYVVELWTTWCGPCIEAMQKMAELQRRHVNDRVQLVSVSNEEKGVIDRFLDKESHSENSDERAVMTNREVYQDFTVAADSSGKTWNRYFKGTGQNSFPHCVVIGPSGLIEWMGHTLELEEPLQQIVDGNWDREKFRKKLETSSTRRTLIEKVSRHAQAKEWAAALSAVERRLEIIDESDSDVQPLIESQLLKLQILIAGFSRQEAETYASQLFSDELTEPTMVDKLAWSVYEMLKNNQFESRSISEAALKRSAKAAGMSAGSVRASLLDTAAHLEYLHGEVGAAIRLETQALELAADSDKEFMRNFLDELKQKQ